jgi:hypothetical protein
MVFRSLVAEHYPIEVIVIRELEENGEAQPVPVELDDGIQVVAGPSYPKVTFARFHQGHRFCLRHRFTPLRPQFGLTPLLICLGCGATASLCTAGEWTAACRASSILPISFRPDDDRQHGRTR